MGKAKTDSASAQGSGSAENKELFDHIVIQDDLDANPELVEAGVKVGDIIQIPVQEEEPKGEFLEAKNPEWAEKLIEVVSELKNEISELRKAQIKSAKEATPNAVASVEDEFDEDADYVVASGKSFRDSKDFTQEYTEGEDVSHLDKEVQRRLFANGLIEEA